MSTRVSIARQVWQAFADRDAAAVVAAAGEAARWRPSHAPDGVAGAAALEGYFAAMRDAGLQQEGLLYAVVEEPGGVVLTGTLRERRDGGHAESQCAWAYRFVGDVLVEGITCRDEAEARRVLAPAATV